jgi:hypothetical protein
MAQNHTTAQKTNKSHRSAYLGFRKRQFCMFVSSLISRLLKEYSTYRPVSSLVGLVPIGPSPRARMCVPEGCGDSMDVSLIAAFVEVSPMRVAPGLSSVPMKTSQRGQVEDL